MQFLMQSLQKIHNHCIIYMSLPPLFPCQTSFHFVTDVFVYAVLALVQKGKNAQSPCIDKVIILLGRCDTAEVGGLSVFRSEN